MELIRGWERKYTPTVLGGLRLSKASVYRGIEDEEGLGDAQEGELRVNMTGKVSLSEDTSVLSPTPLSVSVDLEDGPEFEVKDLMPGFRRRNHRLPCTNGPEFEVRNLMPGETREVRYDLQLEDSALVSPFLFCLSRKPSTESDWAALQAALPDRYDTWTVTEDVCGLNFEIEWGIRRWMALNRITQHRITRYKGWVTYSYDTTPPGVDPSDLGQVLEARWFRKNRRFSGQQEYRLAWAISSPQMETFPDTIDIELTRSGLALFKPWNPKKSGSA